MSPLDPHAPRNTSLAKFSMPAAPAGHLGVAARSCQEFGSVINLPQPQSTCSLLKAYTVEGMVQAERTLGSGNVGPAESPEEGSRAAAVLFLWDRAWEVKEQRL